jgi:hypothetical protein
MRKKKTVKKERRGMQLDIRTVGGGRNGKND